jgi:hypothetical protein
MKQKFLGALFLLLLAPAWAALAPQWKVLYDKAIPTTKDQTLDQDARWINAGYLRTLKGPSITCQVGYVEIKGRLTGHFVPGPSAQRAYLYRSDCDGSLRLAVVTDTGLIFHSFLKRSFGLAAVEETYTLLDINRDGFDEIAVLQGQGEGGYLTRWLTIWNLKAAGARRQPVMLGRFVTEDYACEADAPALRGQHTLYRLWVNPGVKPAFQADVMRASDCKEQTPLKTVSRGVKPVSYP